MGGIKMKSKKKKDKFDGKVNSWTQKLGVSIIGLLTLLGAGLIVYTGVMAATYDQNKLENDYLTYDEVEEGASADQNSEEEEQASVETNNNEAYCNIDGVNIREQAATGTAIIGNLNAGDKVEVLNRYYSDEWVQVSFEGKVGYIYSEYLTFK